MLAHNLIVEEVTRAGIPGLEREVTMALDAIARDRETRRVNRAANRDDASIDDGSGMQKSIPADHDDVSMHPTLDDDIAMQNDDGLRVRRVACQDGGDGRWRDQLVRCREHAREAPTECTRSRVANEDLLSIEPNARKHASDDQQERDARS
jgi:hypothetical protein